MMTEEEEEQITMFMRVSDFMRKHESIVKDNVEIMAVLADVKSDMQQLFDLLSEEDRHQVLERYADDLAYINEQQQQVADKK